MIWEKGNVKSWCGAIEASAWVQAEAVTRHPRIFGHVALMPDAHAGYGIPVGGVVALDNAVIPYGVGLDIGCGMNAVRLNGLTVDMLTDQNKAELLKEIYDEIPMGVGSIHDHGDEISFAYPYYVNAANADRSIGTVGSGNHFIELQYDDNGTLWLMVHSGSRHLGKEVCEHHHEIAKKLCKTWGASLPNQELAFLPLDSDEGQDYWKDMSLALNYAKLNRAIIQEACLEIIGNALSDPVSVDRYSIHHNYAAIENHFGKNVVVHRKGATLAREGTVGIIPGDCGSKSYIVQGKGNPDSYCSCSHGAGRSMSRSAARSTLNADDVKEKMSGVTYRNIDLSEAPGAYKDIDNVMAAQADLVNILHVLRPVINWKGG